MRPGLVAPGAHVEPQALETEVPLTATGPARVHILQVLIWSPLRGGPVD